MAARAPLVLLLAVCGTVAHGQGLDGPPPGAVRPSEPEPSVQPRATAPAAPAAPLPRGAILEEVSGVVIDVDRKAHRVDVESASGSVTLQLDRNTMVYTPAGLGTVLDVVRGAQIRAGRNADLLAYWVQVRAPSGDGADPQPPPGQGSGPGGGSGPPAGESGGAAGTPGAAPGSASPGPASPGP